MTYPQTNASSFNEEKLKQEVAAVNSNAAQPETGEQQAYDSEEQIRRKRKYQPRASTGPASWAFDESDVWLREKTHWTETRMGKVGIELVSRLTLGGIFYSWMSNSDALAKVDSYKPEHFRNDDGKTDFAKLGKSGIMPIIAYAIDKTLGVGIKNLHYSISRDEEKAQKFVTFRENRLSNPVQMGGRSLGAEMVKVTADFAAMSAGSAIMRNTLLGIFNPTERKAWSKEGKFDLQHILQRTGKKLWEIVSYNAGEDVAVALPYVFFLRGSRNFIDKYITPGFRWDSDEVDNGGSVVLNKQGSVMGHMQVAGALDQQARFTVYNVFTQYFRDFYNATAERLKSWRNNGFKITTPGILKDPASIPSEAYHTVSGGLRYLFISMVTSILQMTPSVPFFWALRVPSSKYKGRAINPKLGVMQMEDGTALTAGQQYDEKGNLHPAYSWQTRNEGKTQFYWSQRDSNGNRRKVEYTPVGGGKVMSPNPFSDRRPKEDNDGKFNPFGFSKKGRRLQHDGVARATDIVGKAVYDAAHHKGWQHMSGWFWKLVDPKGKKDHAKLARDAGLAAMPYASYFAAKVYFRDYVNDQMRLAVGRMLDGMLAFNGKEIREGLNEIGKTMQGLPLSNPDRQALLIESHRYNSQDNSPIPSDWTRELHEKYLQHHVENPEKEIGAYDLAHILSERRARYYDEKAQKSHERSQHPISREELEDFINARTGEGPVTPDTLKKKFEKKSASEIARERETKPAISSTPPARNWKERNLDMEEKEAALMA